MAHQIGRDVRAGRPGGEAFDLCVGDRLLDDREAIGGRGSSEAGSALRPRGFVERSDLRGVVTCGRWPECVNARVPVAVISVRPFRIAVDPTRERRDRRLAVRFSRQDDARDGEERCGLISSLKAGAV